jgi:hypothetical protein
MKKTWIKTSARFDALLALRITRVLASFAVLLIASLPAVAQSPLFPRMLPPSPTSSELGKYGNVNVGLSTGAVNYNIPLLTVGSGNINVNIALAYSSGGTKVDQIASRAGLGWVLDAGGVVNRTVYGDRDEAALYVAPPANLYSDSPQVRDYLENVALNKDGYDTEPDIFSFSFNGNAGKFILDQADKSKVIFLNKSALKVATDFSINPSKAWTLKITAPDGIVYYFGGAGGTEKSRSDNSGGPKCGRSYNVPTETAW